MKGCAGRRWWEDWMEWEEGAELSGWGKRLGSASLVVGIEVPC